MNDLPEFNLNIYASALLSGRNVFLYRPMGDHGVLRPGSSTQAKANEYVLNAGDLELMEMASGIDEFKIYYEDVLS